MKPVLAIPCQRNCKRQHPFYASGRNFIGYIYHGFMLSCISNWMSRVFEPRRPPAAQARATTPGFSFAMSQEFLNLSLRNLPEVARIGPGLNSQDMTVLRGG